MYMCLGCSSSGVGGQSRRSEIGSWRSWRVDRGDEQRSEPARAVVARTVCERIRSSELAGSRRAARDAHRGGGRNGTRHLPRPLRAPRHGRRPHHLLRPAPARPDPRARALGEPDGRRAAATDNDGPTDEPADPVQTSARCPPLRRSTRASVRGRSVAGFPHRSRTANGALRITLAMSHYSHDANTRARSPAAVSLVDSSAPAHAPPGRWRFAGVAAAAADDLGVDPATLGREAARLSGPG